MAFPDLDTPIERDGAVSLQSYLNQHLLIIGYADYELVCCLIDEGGLCHCEQV